MKLTAPREDLLAPLQSVIGVVERRQTMPVLANVLLSARDNRLNITGTDLEVELVATSMVNVQQGGDITVPGRKLLDIFKSLPEQVSITLSTRRRADLDQSGQEPFHVVDSPGRGVSVGRGDQRAADIDGGPRRISAPDRQDAFLDGPAGRQVLPERFAARDRGHVPACGRDGWTSPGAVRNDLWRTRPRQTSRSLCRARVSWSCSARWARRAPLSWRSEPITFAPRSAQFASLRS